MIKHTEDLKKNVDELQEEYERVTWANNLKVGDEVLIRYCSQWKEKSKVDEIYKGCYIVHYSSFDTDGILLGNNNYKLYPLTGEYIKEYERIELVEKINKVVKQIEQQKNNEELKIILDVANDCLNEKKAESSNKRLMVQVPGLLLTEETTRYLLERYNITFDKAQIIITERNLCIGIEKDYSNDYRMQNGMTYYSRKQDYCLGHYDTHNRFQCYFKLYPDKNGVIATYTTRC